MSNLPWVEKYRPKTKKELVGNDIAINGLYLFLKNWSKKKSKSAVLLLGPAGCGKTSATYAVANDLGYKILEVNASDTRKKSTVKDVLGIASEFSTFDDDSSFKRLILMDEVDGLSGRYDRGGLAEFIKILKTAIYPIVCTANDPESDKITKLQKHMRTYVFNRLDEFEIFELLLDIAQKEKVEIQDEILEQIAENSAGDLRAAINELESQARGSNKVHLVKRNKMKIMVDVLNDLYRSKTFDEAEIALRNAPSDYFSFLMYIFDETSKQCRSPKEISNSYSQIALADLTYSRIMKTQDWSLLKYFFLHLGPGIALSKDSKNYKKIDKLPNLPNSLIFRGIAKRKISTALKIAPKASKKLHISKRHFIYKDYNLFSKIILGPNGAEIAAWLDLDDEDIDALMKINPNSQLEEEIIDARIKIANTRVITKKSDSFSSADMKNFSLDNFISKQITDEEDNLEEPISINNPNIEDDENSKKNQKSLDEFF